MVSLVLRVTWRDRELWLMGDALAIQERDLLDLRDPGFFRHRLLKVGHHGSRNASDAAWIAALQPEVAIIPAGFRNRFEHPHTETMETFRRLGLTPWITGTASGVLVTAVEGGWRVDTGDGASAFRPFRKTPQP
jgi:competence protein ComEC